MAYRNRTDDFIRWRDDHTMRKRKYKDYNSKKTLLDNEDVEMKEHIVYLPPEWIAKVSDIQYDLTNIRTKLQNLSDLHKAHLLPGFHDKDDEEHGIEIATAELTKMFRRMQASIKRIGQETDKFTADEKQLKGNIQSELAREIQELTISFRQSQKNYLQALRSRQKKIGQFGMQVEDIEPDIYTGFSSQQLALINDLEDRITQREKDILAIAKSIQELAEIFNDLNILVIDQVHCECILDVCGC